VPRKTSVTVTGFTGTAQVGSLSAPVAFELLSGSLSATRLGRARLAIAGGGTLTVAQVDGELDLEIAGSGEITVEDGNIPSLSVETNGTSSVFVGGQVENARMSLNGVSDVTVAEVAQEPQVDANGIVTVRIGNR
jgi:hypothetical protein